FGRAGVDRAGGAAAHPPTGLAIAGTGRGESSRRCHGPQIANVIPGFWMLTNSVRPSGEKHAPANSTSLYALRARWYRRPLGVMPTRKSWSLPSSQTMRSPFGEGVMLSGPSSNEIGRAH